LPEVAVASVTDALREATAVFAAAGCDSPRLDAELLLAHVLGVDRAQLVVRARDELSCGDLGALRALIARREAREPVAYIVGWKAFRRITLSVDRRVLIPRPETELLVEVGLLLPAGASVVDVGTGSGAVALALKSERPDLTVRGTDLDPGALAVARANAVRLGLEVDFAQADLLDGVGSRFDAVLANLPYVAAGAELAPEIALYEPARALYAGPDGLDLVRRLVAEVGADVGLLALEVGAGQARAVADLLAGRLPNTDSIEIVRDLAGHERVVVARR